MENKDIKKNRKKANLKNRNVLLILGLIYTLVTILAVISYVSRTTSMSTTSITLASVLGSIWWQLLMIALFVVSYIMYLKKTIYGILIEIIMGISMLVYIIISAITMGVDLVALLIEFIYPLILVFHSLIELKKLSKHKNKSTI